ncbi:flagellar basal body-associated FliL family protein [Shewanella sp. A32]|uniref:flagellar basal body-associated FliL family protein n=1 Tax=Shewanella sp. A32 TaxID=3031327 RepID=UPI0023B8A69D|nr:flagellar basal body-associated FliL family protein [Shewanella sp. A32]MDF0535726.1 flagellar basal body-associated FliL family protein [Shewanella sp. A32]
MKAVLGIVLAVVLLALGIGAGIYYGKSAKETSQTHADKAAEIPSSMLFYPMARFVASVSDENYSRYLVLELSLSTRSQAFLAQLDHEAPVLRNVLVKYFANFSRDQAKQTFDDVNSLQHSLLQKFNDALKQQGVDSKLEQVLVTNVYLQ